ncbi:EamA family transporter [Pelagibius litoralis]|uniref:EamA family transporter n=2 Tax=Pelagibius litoralis TaxID=374515 RepID=A0A967C232_9PROT|nr:EamA family transporter [Pelagibius litoralis]
MAIWGLNFAVAKIGLTQLPPLIFMTLRFLLVAALLLPFAKLPRGQWLPLFGISFTLGILHFSFMFTGLITLDAATAAIAIQLQVPFAALLAAFFFNDKLGWRRGFAMLLAFAGVAVIAGEPRLDGQYTALGFVIFAACMWSVANVQIKRLGQIDGFTLNAWISVFAMPQLALASLLLEDGQWAALQQANFWAYFAIVYQAVAVVVIGYGAWYWMLRRYQMNQIMPAMLLIPVFGVLSGIVFLGETLTANLVIGGLLTVGGVGIIILRRPKATAPEAGRV